MMRLLWSAKLMSFQLSEEKRIIEKNTYFFNIINITCNTLPGHQLVELRTNTISFCDPPRQD